MTTEFIRQRITELRLQKGVSEYKMSLDLGHSKGYIQSISCGRALPSLPEFIYLCEYLNVSLPDFFDTEKQNPILTNEVYTQLKNLNEKDLQAILMIIECLQTKN